MTSPNCLWRAGDYGDLAFQVPFYTSVIGVGDDPSAVYVESFNVETLGLQTHHAGGEDDVPLMLSWDFLMWRNGLVVKLAASTVAPSELSCKFQQTTCRSAPRPDRSVLYDRPYLCVSRFIH